MYVSRMIHIIKMQIQLARKIPCILYRLKLMADNDKKQQALFQRNYSSTMYCQLLRCNTSTELLL